MTTTPALFPTSATGLGLGGSPSHWTNPGAAVGAPNGVYASNDDPQRAGRQQLVLGGYAPQAAVLTATGGRVPYSVERLQVQVWFSIDDSATNYDDVSVQLLNARGDAFASGPLYLLNTGGGEKVTGTVTFTGHTGYGGGTLTWADLDGLAVGLQITRSGAAGADTFRVDGAALFVAYTLDQPIYDTSTALSSTTVASLRAYDRHGQQLGVLPWTSLSRTIVRNAPGSLTAVCPKSLLTDALLGEEVYLRVVEDGVEAPDWYLLLDDGDDDANDGGTARPVNIGATGVAEVLEWGTVYSWQYVPHADPVLAQAVTDATQRRDNALRSLNLARRQLGALYASGTAAPDQITVGEQVVQAAEQAVNTAGQALNLAIDHQAQQAAAPLLGLDPNYPFGSQTPGAILGTLIDAAKARGCFPHLTYSFTADADSAGRAWPAVYSRTYDLGMTLGKVLSGMVDDAWVDYEFTGFRLDLYTPDDELAIDFPDSVLRLGKGVTQAPRKRTRKTSRSTVLANGAQGATVEVSDTNAIARLGRRETYEGRGGITDLGTLTAATQVSLSRQTTASESVTLAVDPGTAPPIPRPGGYLRYDQRRLGPTELEPMRVQSVAWDYGDSPKLSLELNDLWTDRSIRLARQIDTIVNGSSANERVPPPPLGDEKPPSPVTGLAVVSAPYQDPVTGTQFAQATATWLPVTTDNDGTPVAELRGYALQWRQPDVTTSVYRIDATAGQTLASWSTVVPGSYLQVRIAAYDRWDNYSDWSEWVQVMAGVDNTPPAQPTTPVVDNYLGLLRVQWDGGFVGGSARPADLDAIEVHVSALDKFTPGPDTLAGTLYAPGYLFLDTPYKQPRYVQLVGVDTTGNRSAASAQASGATGQLVSADLFDGVLDDSRLIASVGLFKTANILELNLNSGVVSTLDVGKLAAGTITANVLVGNRIATGDRGKGVPVVELSSLGIFRWDEKDVQTVAIDKDGALITGRYRTAASGRRIEMGAAGNDGRVDFLSPTGYNGFVRSWTQSNGVEAVQIGMQVPGYTDSFLWNRINYNASVNGEYATYRSGTHEFMFDSTPPNDVTGAFRVFQGVDRDRGYASERLNISAQGEVHTLPLNKGYRFDEWRGNGTLWTSHEYNTVTRSHTFKATDQNARFQMVAGGGSYSPTLRMFSDNTGGGLRFYDAGPARIEAIWFDGSGFIQLSASNVAVTSDAATKQDIAAVDRAELLTALRKTPVSRYRRRNAASSPHPGGTDTTRAAAKVAGPVELGLIAQDAPEQITDRASDGTLAVDLYQMAAVTWGATGHLADLVEAQGQAIGKLTAALAQLERGGKA